MEEQKKTNVYKLIDAHGSQEVIADVIGKNAIGTDRILEGGIPAGQLSLIGACPLPGYTHPSILQKAIEMRKEFKEKCIKTSQRRETLKVELGDDYDNYIFMRNEVQTVYAFQHRLHYISPKRRLTKELMEFHADDTLWNKLTPYFGYTIEKLVLLLNEMTEFNELEIQKLSAKSPTLQQILVDQYGYSHAQLHQTLLTNFLHGSLVHTTVEGDPAPNMIDYIGLLNISEESLTPAEVEELKGRMEQVIASSKHLTKEPPTLTGVCRELAKDTIVMDSFSAHEEK